MDCHGPTFPVAPKVEGCQGGVQTKEMGQKNGTDNLNPIPAKLQASHCCQWHSIYMTAEKKLVCLSPEKVGNLNHGILPARHSSLKIRENSLVMSPLTKSTKESLGIFMIPVSFKWLANGKWKWLYIISDFPTLHPSWWKNSCTTWHVWNPVNNGINMDKLPIRWCRISAINSISIWLLFGSWARRRRAHATIGKFHGRFFRIFLPWPQRTSHIIVSYDEGPMIDEDEDPEFTACQCGWHKETSEYCICAQGLAISQSNDVQIQHSKHS